MAGSLRERIYKKIRDDITYGNLSPGERLTESDLVNMFHVSRGPIREVLRQLESESLILFENNKGIKVSKLSIKQVEEIYNLRWVLESYATRLSAETMKKKHVMELRRLQEKLKSAASNLDLVGWLETNTSFHDLLSQNCGNSNLIQILDILKRRIYRYKYIVIRIPGHLDQYVLEHEGILKGCEKNDGQTAEKYMKIHIEHIKKILIDYLNKFPAI